MVRVIEDLWADAVRGWSKISGYRDGDQDRFPAGDTGLDGLEEGPLYEIVTKPAGGEDGEDAGGGVGGLGGLRDGVAGEFVEQAEDGLDDEAGDEVTGVGGVAKDDEEASGTGREGRRPEDGAGDEKKGGDAVGRDALKDASVDADHLQAGGDGGGVVQVEGEE